MTAACLLRAGAGRQTAKQQISPTCLVAVFVSSLRCYVLYVSFAMLKTPADNAAPSCHIGYPLLVLVYM